MHVWTYMRSHEPRSGYERHESMWIGSWCNGQHLRLSSSRTGFDSRRADCGEAAMEQLRS